MASLPNAPLAEHRLLGIAARLGNSLAFAMMGALMKAASTRGVSAWEMVFYRNAAALPVVLGWLLVGPGLGAVRTRQPMAHLTRSGVGFFSMLLTFTALTMLPLAEATTLAYSAPIGATLLSAILLHEHVGARRWTAVAIGFLGMLLVANPGHGVLPPLGLLAALGASLGQSAVMVTLRQIGRTEGTAAIVFWFTVLMTAAGALLLVPFGRLHDPHTYALLLMGGALGGAGQLCMTASLRLAPVSVVVPFDYAQIIWATLLGWAAFGSSPAVTTLLGAALIAGSGIYTAWRESRLGRRSGQAEAPPEP